MGNHPFPTTHDIGSQTFRRWYLTQPTHLLVPLKEEMGKHSEMEGVNSELETIY